MAIKVKDLNNEFRQTKLKELREILAKTKTLSQTRAKIESINETMFLSNSYALTIRTPGGKNNIDVATMNNTNISFKMAFYGKYVRAYYLKKKHNLFQQKGYGVSSDILYPLFSIRNLIGTLQSQTKDAIVDEIKTEIDKMKAAFATK